MTEIKREGENVALTAPKMVERFYEVSLKEEDKDMTAMGCCFCIFSRKKESPRKEKESPRPEYISMDGPSINQ